jgi:hypothetical protein
MDGGGGGQKTGGSIPSVGTSDALELLKYRFGEDSPPYCQSPDQLLDAIVARVTAAGGPCLAQKIAAAGVQGDSTLVIRCNVEDPVTACTEVYRANLWIERDAHSLSDYTVLAQGYSRSVCPSGVFPASDEFSEKVAHRSDEIESLLRPCRPEIVP